MFKHIFVPLDSSQCSRAALDVAIGLASQNGALLTVCHVVDVKNAVPVFPESGVAVVPWLENARFEGAEVLETARTLALAANVFCDTVQIDGPVASSLIDCANARGADLIVLGSHGRTGLSHFLLGSVAETVLHKASVPVTIVRTQQSCVAAGKFRHILVAHDGSDHSERAFSTALDLAAIDDASVSVCYVVDLGNIAKIAGTAYFAADIVVDALGREGREILRQCMHRAPQAQTHLLTGIPAEEILECARRIHADAIVMGSHGRSGIARAMLGSVAESVMRRALTPVIVVTDRVPAAPQQPRELASHLHAI